MAVYIVATLNSCFLRDACGFRKLCSPCVGGGGAGGIAWSLLLYCILLLHDSL